MINKAEILARFARNEVSAAERAAFHAWVQTCSAAEVEALMDEYGEILVHIEPAPATADETLLAAIHQEIATQEARQPGPLIRRIALRRWSQAAAVALLLGVGIYFWKTRQRQSVQAPVVVVNKDIAPGKEGALLTLGDGSVITLDSAHTGQIAQQGGATARISGNSLVYDKNGRENVYNTMRTPNGRQFQLVLPDGTKVWLNAASSIRYPTLFAGKERLVTVTGEAYFEVAANADMPFRVNVNDKAEIEVLGTDFNVNAYNNEATISTTLVSGSVRILSERNKGVIIKPGQQAQITIAAARQGNQHNTGIEVVSTDVEKAVAWKNGLFYFDNMTLPEAMRQLERWYDIRVVYEKEVPDIKLTGKMTKQVTLGGLLVVLEELGVHSKLEANTLTITAK
ncbi:FecR domain-containing protein [Chitinophaga pinensis]|uniref:Anti-FecI sigma factor, FecR n=1 Tax=Chitinophaga pinensis (strain ATCC 43595 / DSM 2588 / LMG 13176 / NBRC 15968 / NCIMB 11800 / UQM 2034) TaxID=485918 RepID=A0A979H0W5_CHIPD|nr:FecR domain-containing protein [Chitinophaga pinensis]ACU63830.1 anti-FecI sigma factor, FecR [Chitinophaga pinensis DSM 2588]